MKQFTKTCFFLLIKKNNNNLSLLEDEYEKFACHLAAGCFNSGNASLNRIASYFEEVFNTDLSHFPRDFYEMRIRLDQVPYKT
jgi:hypothetical protein